MNFPKIDPSMLNNINPEQMKMASDMLSGMSDEQLRNYGKMMGMGDIDPSMLRSSAGMMKNMDRHQFETMKNTAKQHYGSTNNNSTSTPTSSNTQSSQPSSTQASVSRYSGIESLKLKGNDFFKKQSYDEAASAYFEAIIDIEEIRSKKDLKDSELDALEVSCRLNYANVKAKLNEFDTVMMQAKAVLKIQENGKAYFRLGQALSHFKKYEEAQKNLEKAVPLLPNDTTVTELLQQVKSNIKAQEPKETKPDTKPETKKETQPETKSNPEQETSSKTQEETKPKMMKKKHAPDVEAPITKEEPKASKVEAPFDYLGSKKAEQEKEKETVIEEEKIPERNTSSASNLSTSQREEFKTAYGNVPADQVKRSQDELSKMNPDQLKSMTETFKNMDNETLKRILKSQSGMDMSDEQIKMMKSMMTPDMLSNFSKMNMSNLPKMPAQQGAPSSATSSSAENMTAPSTEPLLGDQPGFPGSGMDLGSDQIQNMMEMVIQNPEMLKNLVAMLGENNPVAKMLQNKSPEQLAKYMRVLQKLLKFYGKVSPLVKILKQYWQLLAGLLIAYVIYRMTR